MESLTAAPALRFWATLTAAQREETARRPLTGEDLDEAQRLSYARAVLEASHYGVFLPGALAAVLAGREPSIRFAVAHEKQYSFGSPKGVPTLSFRLGSDGEGTFSVALDDESEK